MYAPAPTVNVNTEGESRALNALAKPAAFFGLAHGALQTLRLGRVLTADVNISLAGADGITGDRHAFQKLLRLGVDEDAIFEHQRLRLVGVADDIFLRRRFLQHHPPLAPRRKARATASGQSCGLDFIDHRAGRSCQRFSQTLIGTVFEG